MTKKAVFCYSISDKNAGDFSLSIAAIDLLVEAGFFVTIVSRFAQSDEEFMSTGQYMKGRFGGQVEMAPSPFYLNRSASVLAKLKSHTYSFLVLLGVIRRGYIKDFVKQADLVVLCGGNLLRCASFADLLRLLALNYPLNIAYKLDKEYVILPQSSAQINFWGRRVLGRMLERANAVFIREKLSFERLKDRYEEANLVSSLDLAFYLMDETLFKPSNESRSIALTIRGDTLGGLGGVSKEEAQAIESAFIDIVSNLKGATKFTIVVQGTVADRYLSEKVKDAIFCKLGVDVELVEEHDTFNLIEYYSSFDLLIGMRLHSVILAAIAGTPSFGLFRKDWGLKNPGIMDQLELPYAYIDEYKGFDVSAVHELMNGKEMFQNMIKSLVVTNRDVIDRKLLEFGSCNVGV